MKQSEQILKKVEKDCKGKMTMTQYHQILTLADHLSKCDEAEKWIKRFMYRTEKEADEYIEQLCEELDNDYDKNDPESWDCDADEYADRMSDLTNRMHEQSEGMER